MATRYKVVWLTEYNGKLAADGEPDYFDHYQDAKRLFDEFVWESTHNDHIMSSRQVVKLYYGTKLADVFDSKPKRKVVTKAKATAKRKAKRRM